ncbi:MAG: CO dehydrogenase/acetyl-CoA synthase complex subunit epsilon [Candidatus Helarchaeales archaeon]
MYKVRPWQPIATVGPTAGTPMEKPIVLAKMLGKAKRPILVVGVEFLKMDMGDGKQLIDYIIEMGKKIPIVATANSPKLFLEKGFTPHLIMSSADIVQRLSDSEWKGIDGNGQYDFAAFISFPYVLITTLLNHLKHYARGHLKTIFLGRGFQPNASYSLVNLSKKDYIAAIKEIVAEVTK